MQIHDELADQVFRILVGEKREMTFRAAPDSSGDTDEETLIVIPEGDELDETGVAARHRDTRLQTAMSSKRLQTRLRSIAYDAKTVESEQGVNVLYLALGFLTWFEAREADKPRHAPLILVPVTLSRGSVNERFKLKYSDQEIGTNLSLQQRLTEEGVVLPDLPEQEDIVPSEYAQRVTEAIGFLPRWEVRPDTMVLGFYSFAKLMMYRDLEPERWPLQAGLRDHPIINCLLGDGFRDDSAAMPSDDEPVDPHVDIGNGEHVVDADSSQTLAIHDVQTGRNLVIQGPPGTGKSQTITNLIASAVRRGQRVLFVAEKLAALQVVRANLDKAGLGRVCLELHSHKAKKKVVLDDLEETYLLARHGVVDASGVAAQLRWKRDELNAYVKRLHQPLSVPGGFTPFEVLGTLSMLAGKGVRPCNVEIRLGFDCPRPEMEERLQKVKRVGNLIGSIGLPTRHPWRYSGLDVALPLDASRLAERARDMAARLQSLQLRGETLAGTLGLSCTSLGDIQSIAVVGAVFGKAPSVDRTALHNEVWLHSREDLSSLIGEGEAYDESRRSLKGVLTSDAWSMDFTSTRRALAKYGDSIFRILHKEFRQAATLLKEVYTGLPPTAAAHRVAILDTLSAGQRAREFVRAHDALGKAAFGTKWKGDESDWSALDAVVKWEHEASNCQLALDWRNTFEALGNPSQFGDDSSALFKDAASVIPNGRELFESLAFDLTARFGISTLESVPFVDLIRTLTEMADAPDRLQEWCTWRLWSRDLRDVGLGGVVEELGDGRIQHDEAELVVRYGTFEALGRRAFEECPELARFQGLEHETTRVEFQRLDRERMRLAREEVLAQHVVMMPSGQRGVGEMGTLSREWAKQRRHLSIRQLVKAAGRAMQGIKPVWMMSPLSLAQFVEPGTVGFDLLLMDEASQVRPVEALGAIGRAKQVVVVGDDKQLPPTTFFDRLTSSEEDPSDADEFQVGDVESILGLCSSKGLPNRMLRWHYRSQHESLIAISNLEFYRRLFIVPSAWSEGLGLTVKRVAGVYDRGGTASNRLEAQEVAKAVIAHAVQQRKSARYPEGMSLGVGAFSVAQRDAILNEVELLCRDHPELSEFFDPDAPEPFFVKNLESIQGDERDVIFISVGYGPDSSGYMAMSFGPLSAQGGERRLNVLMTRARRRCEVFTSFSSADIDLARTQSAGVRILKSFLQYAETGHFELSIASPDRPIESDFEADVGASLASVGYKVRHQIGVAGFFIDLAVMDPEQPARYLLGIECDGATYHSSRSARDRDRLRDQVLRDRGWQIYRIWSTDWFTRRNQELQKVIAAIEKARLSLTPLDSTDVTPSDQFEAGGAQSVEPDGVPPSGASHLRRSDSVEGETQSAELEQSKPPQTATLPYEEASFQVQLQVEPHQVRTTEFLQILTRIVSVEQPIHREELARRYAEVCGRDRAGSRIQDAVDRTLQFAVRARMLTADGSFYSVRSLESVPPRDRTMVRSSSLRLPTMLSPLEIRTGIRQIVEDHIGVEPRAVIIEVARMFGFQRTGQELQRVIENELRGMLGDFSLVLRNDNRLYLPE